MFRPVSIAAVLNGWIVTVGCQTVVYQERNQLVSDLDAYLKDPTATEERFLKASVNQGQLGASTLQPPSMSEGASTMSESEYRRREREMVASTANALSPRKDRG